jgi:3-oxoacyl-[acyl-carrier protein] reductase
MDLHGKVAIVTGGGTGMGKEISKLLAQAGAHVVVNYSRSEDDAVATAKELEANDVRAIPLKADVSAAADVVAMIERTEREFGRLDVLVNNAGTTAFVPMQDLEGLTEDDWDRIMDVNVKGIWLCSRAAAPAMRRAGAGAIVNITSVAGLRPVGSSLAYSVSKAAAIHLTKGLAVALAPQIRVNAVAPGTVLTRWWAHADEDRRSAMREGAALKHTVDPVEIATATIELIRNDSITGQNLTVDAGNLLP